MERTGIANLPLHYGRCPSWIFEMMKRLGRAISEIIIAEHGQSEFLKRLSDPYFFQAFGCVLGFDFHSSGLTVTTLGALKEARLDDIGIFVCGGKGKTSRKTPEEIEQFSGNVSLSTKKIENLKYSSRMAAKVDSAAIQDGYQLYHHAFVFSENGSWAVIQQGMNANNRYARRYHWLSDEVKGFVEEPNNAICCDKKEARVLDMTASESRGARKISVEVVNEKRFLKFFRDNSLNSFLKNEIKILSMPQHHFIKELSRQTKKSLEKAYEIQPENYEELLSIQGIGPKSIRALALISELVYGSPPSWQNPVKFSFAHGGKDHVPFPVDKKTYEKSVEILRTAIDNAKMGAGEQLRAMERLSKFLSPLPRRSSSL